MKRAVLVLVIVSMVAVCSSAYSQARKGEKPRDHAKDPVCGLTVDKNPDLSVTYSGEKYYFCSISDMNKFKQNPEKYAGKKK